ncbi:hypothetical protein midi_00108 [Candidatus Midichloria mitochondrii IricVA]|uniref:Uncharacterized protein n=2 Tax=Candidatus Midichloria mitochondrii TaxID=234827 RepID=F7XUT0_MIDMI|nr:hypothetical protein midi_00108 [Candidatus Midichloria mitochondrii IricVA]
MYLNFDKTMAVLLLYATGRFYTYEQNINFKIITTIINCSYSMHYFLATESLPAEVCTIRPQITKDFVYLGE